MITAHSGSDGYKDNSREFIIAMLNSDVEAFEIDCHLSPDNTLYLNHDKSDDFHKYLTLSNLFQMMSESNNEDIIVNIDCKGGKGVGPLAVELAKEFNLLERIVLSGGLNIEDYDTTFRNQLFYNLENSIDYSDSTTIEEVEQVLAELERKGIKIIQLYYKLVDRDIISLADRYQIKLSVWTVNDLDIIDKYLAMGCHNVTSRIALEYLSKNNG